MLISCVNLNNFLKEWRLVDGMPTLIACLSTGKGTWSEVTRIIGSQPWTKVFLVTNEFGNDNFKRAENMELIILNGMAELSVMVEELKKQLQGRISDFEVGLNLVSGTGKEHMAILEAVMELGLNFRLITVNNGQVETLGLRR